MKKSYFAHVFNLKAEFPKFRIQKKEDSNLMKFISWVLFLITFGQMKRETFMDLFVTTLGYTVYVNSSWDGLPEDDKLSVLIHEATHIRQYDEEGVLFALKYALFPLPVLFAHSRLDYEIEAFATEIVHDYLYREMFLFGPKFENAIKLLSGPSYFWPTRNKGMVGRKLRQMISKKLKEMSA